MISLDNGISVQGRNTAVWDVPFKGHLLAGLHRAFTLLVYIVILQTDAWAVY